MIVLQSNVQKVINENATMTRQRRRGKHEDTIKHANDTCYMVTPMVPLLGISITHGKPHNRVNETIQ